MSILTTRALAIARSEADARVRESDGPNDSRRIREYGKVVGIRPPDPWCAAFVCWAVQQAARQLGLPDPIRYSAYTPELYGRCRHLKSWVDIIQAGDLFFLHNTRLGRIAHVGFVASTIDRYGRFATIEGNTNSGGSRDGDGVYCRVRINSDLVVFARIPDAAA